ncbi:MAG: hypothetical protein QM772_03360 [Ottowia sp.]|uniref:hypothetical protein n=1 Tax=Ottowia sp. TaxID=1898956 RepID=UPI0039E63125
MKKKTATSTIQPCPFTPDELARMTPSARKLCEMVGKYPAPRDLTPEEIELLRASKHELAALAFATHTRAGARKVAV